MASKTPKYDAKVKEILDATKPGERTCELSGQKWDMSEEEINRDLERISKDVK